MSKVYNIIDPNKPIEEIHDGDAIVSKDYVDVRIKALEDTLNSHLRNIDNPHTKSTDGSEDLAPYTDNIEEEDITINDYDKTVRAKDVEEDPNHKFIPEATLINLKNKVSTLELEQAINETKTELKDQFNEIHSKLINMPNAIPKLKKISALLEDDETLNLILTSLADKIDATDFDNHVKSISHVTESDRKALNVLIALIKNGLNLDSLEDNIIPVTLPKDIIATSGNADTLCGLSPEELACKTLEVVTCGIYPESSKHDVSVYFKSGIDLTKDIYKLFNNIIIGGLVGFKAGKYYVNELAIIGDGSFSKRIVINGSGISTHFWSDHGKSEFRNVTVNNCRFENYDSIIRDESEFNNCAFNNCIIMISNSNMIKFTNCRFYNCTFTIGLMYNSFIINNTFINCFAPKYLSGNNIIKDNIEC